MESHAIVQRIVQKKISSLAGGLSVEAAVKSLILALSTLRPAMSFFIF